MKSSRVLVMLLAVCGAHLVACGSFKRNNVGKSSPGPEQSETTHQESDERSREESQKNQDRAKEELASGILGSWQTECRETTLGGNVVSGRLRLHFATELKISQDAFVGPGCKAEQLWATTAAGSKYEIGSEEPRVGGAFLIEADFNRRFLTIGSKSVAEIADDICGQKVLERGVEIEITEHDCNGFSTSIDHLVETFDDRAYLIGTQGLEAHDALHDKVIIFKREAKN